jgi:plastocyanin/N-acetylneuraminic acid mutarotase
MKKSNAGRLVFWMAIIFAITFLVRAESGGRRSSAPSHMHSGPPAIRILDQNGQPAVSGAPSATSTIVDVTVGPDFAFHPSTVNINVGDTVRWTWAGSGHSVHSGPHCVPDSQFCSPNDANCFPGVTSNVGTVYTHTFSTSGTYSYICIAHCALGMTGVVNVSGGCSPPDWSAGPDLSSTGVRFVGVYFQPNGKFYLMGGRSMDGVGNDFVHPFEYDPGTNAWTTKGASYPDNQVNNMACGVLTDAGTPYIYCVGGSAGGQTTAINRVFRYNPVTDSISAVNAPWPGDNDGITLPGGFATINNKLYTIGGFQINTAMTNQIWEFTPTANTWVQKVSLPVQRGYVPATTIGNLIYTAGGSLWDGTTLQDTMDSFVFDPVANTINPITNIPRATGETRALNFNGQMWVMGGGRTSPNPSNEVDVYDPGTNTWSLGPAFATARRNFGTDTDGTSRIWLVGGYASDGLTPLSSMEKFCNAGGGTPTPTPTATATATATTTATPTVTVTATPTGTPSHATPTPRPRPTPAPRPTP